MDQRGFRQLLASSSHEPRRDESNYAMHNTTDSDGNVSMMQPRSVLLNRSSESRQEQYKQMLGAEEAASGRTKGLDFALLAKQKERMAQSSEPQEVDLDAAFMEGQQTAQANADAEAQAAEYRAKFRKVAAHPEAPDIIYVNGKRMRKKKKKSLDPQPVSEPRHTNAVPDDVPPVDEKQRGEKRASRDERVTAPSSSGIDASQANGPTRASQPAVYTGHMDKSRSGESDDDAADIFDDAGVWNGLSSDDEHTPAPTSTTDKASTSLHGTSTDWFRQGTSTRSDLPAQPSSSDPETDTVPAPDQNGPSVPASTAGPQRLQGLSSSALPSEWSRWLLDREEKKARHASSEQEQAVSAPRKRRRSRKGRGDGDSP